jgi:hypothetical protein
MRPPRSTTHTRPSLTADVEAISSTTADTTTEPAADGSPICACGAAERHATNPHMCRNGHFVPGNGARRLHGVDGFRTRGTLPDVLRQTVDEFRQAIIADRGGDAELSTLEHGYARRIGEVEAVLRLLASDLAKRGLFTPRGRVRNTYGRWLEGLAAWDRLAQRIGTARRSRTVPTLHDYLAAASGMPAGDAEPHGPRRQEV